FNLLNETGPNSSPFPDPSFPVVTAVPFSDLELFVNFADGSAEVFPSSSGYFALSTVDNLSFIGQQESDFVTKAISSAILTGTFGATNLTLNDGSHVTIPPSFTAIITDPLGSLQDGDFSLITASATTVAAPEPASAALLACGL